MDKKDAARLLNDIYARKVITGFYPSKNKFKNHLKQKKVRIFVKVDAGKLNLHLGQSQNFLLLEKFRQMGFKTYILMNDIDPFVRQSFNKNEGHPLQKNLDALKFIMSQILDFDDEKNPCSIELISQRLNKNSQNPPEIEICGQDKVDAEKTHELNRILCSHNLVTISMATLEQDDVKMSCSKNTGIFISNSKGQLLSCYAMYKQIISSEMNLINLLLVNHTNFSASQIKNILLVDKHLGLKFLVTRKVCECLFGDAVANSAAKSFEQSHLTYLDNIQEQ